MMDKRLCLKTILSLVTEITEEVFSHNDKVISTSGDYSPIFGDGSSEEFVTQWFSRDLTLYNLLKPYLKSSSSISDFLTAKSHNISRAYKINVFDNYIFIDIDNKMTEYAEALKETIRHHCYYFQYKNRLKEGNASLIENKMISIELDLKNNQTIYDNSLARFSILLIQKTIECVKNIEVSNNTLERLLNSRKLDPYKKLALITFLAIIPKDQSFDGYKDDIQTKIFNVLYDKYCTYISKEDVYAAGKNWFDSTKVEGNRFIKMFPDEDILPLAEITEDLPLYGYDSNTEIRQLMDIITDVSGHIYLIGEGGIGKTTALYNIMKNSYGVELNCSVEQIPLFIELSMAYNKNDFNGQSSHYIHHEIQRQIQKVIDIEKNWEQEIARLFTQKGSCKPEYVLLLDGLNEVSREKLFNRYDESLGETQDTSNDVSILTLVVNEIRYIMENYNNVRVIITSRTNVNIGDKATTIQLSGVNDAIIKSYLKDKVDNNKLNRTINNKRLMNTLRIPLFLTLYTRLYGEEELLSKGEILHSFYTQKKDYYTEKSRAVTINDELIKKYNIMKTSKSITPDMLCFFLDFIIPEIAWEMVKKESLEISKDAIEVIVKNVLTDKTENSILGKYGRKCFYKGYSEINETVSTVAKKIENAFSSNEDDNDEKWERITTGICECLSLQLGVLKSYSDFLMYKAVHQHVRDYFAALHHINRLRLAAYIFDMNNDLARSCLDEWIKPLPTQILIFIGEALGENHNEPQYNKQLHQWEYIVPNPEEIKCDRNLIKRCFSIFRHSFDGEDKCYVWNLFQILKLTRNDLSGEDFSFLDLSACHANGHRLGNRTFASLIRGAKLNEKFFLPLGHSEWLHDACFSPDSNYIVTASSDKTAKVWSTKTFEEVGSFKHDGPVYSANYSFDGNYIVTASGDRTARIWDAETYQEIGRLCGHNSEVVYARFSNDDKYIVTASSDRTARIWDAKTCQEIGRLYGHKSTVVSAQFNRNGDYLVTASEDGLAKIWDFKTCKEVGLLDNHIEPQQPTQHDKKSSYFQKLSGFDPSSLTSAQFSYDGKYILTASKDNTAKIWDSKTKQIVGTLYHDASVNSARFSSDGNFIVTASSDCTVTIWNAKSLKKLSAIKGHNGIVSSAQFSTNGNYIVTSSWDRTAIIWDAKSFEEVGTLRGQGDGVKTAEYSPKGDYILTVSRDNIARIWDERSSKKIGAIYSYENELNAAHYSPDGNSIVTAIGNTIKIWNASYFEEVKTLTGHKKGVIISQYSPKGDYLLSSSIDDTTKIWDTTCWAERQTKEGLSESFASFRHRPLYFISSACYSPNGENIVFTDNDFNVRVLTADTLEVIGTIVPKGLGRFRSAQYSPDGKFLVVVSIYPNSALIFETDNYEEIGSLKNHSFINSAEYSPFGNYIVTTSDNIAKVWDAHSRIEIGTLTGHTDTVISAKFSPDEEKIVTASEDNTIKIWKISKPKTCELIKTIPILNGIDVQLLDLTNLYEDKYVKISDDILSLLKLNGAK